MKIERDISIAHKDEEIHVHVHIHLTEDEIRRIAEAAGKQVLTYSQATTAGTTGPFSWISAR